MRNVFIRKNWCTFSKQKEKKRTRQQNAHNPDSRSLPLANCPADRLDHPIVHYIVVGEDCCFINWKKNMSELACQRFEVLENAHPYEDVKTFTLAPQCTCYVIKRGRRVFIIDVLRVHSQPALPQILIKARVILLLCSNTPQTDPSSVSGILPSQQVAPCPTSPRLGPPYAESPSRFGRRRSCSSTQG